MKNLDRVFKKLAILIDYPHCSISDIREAGNYIFNLIDAPGHFLVPYMESFLEEINTFSSGALQEHYTKTFDFSENTTLYLTYYILKESKKRGELLIEISETYRKEGFNPSLRQLPDYLPDVLGFLSLYAGRNNLSGINDFSKRYVNKGLESIATGLKNIKSPYLHPINLIKKILNPEAGDDRLISV